MTGVLYGRYAVARVLAGFLVLIISAIVHGVWTHRWSEDGDLDCALESLDAIPGSVGPWKGREQPLEEEKAEAAARVGIPRVVQRQYVHEGTKDAVSVILMAGRFGPLSVHTPDVCYGTAGYVMLGKPTRLAVARDDGLTSEFWTVRFHKPQSPETAPLRIFWAWNATGDWQAPDNPRWTFRQQAVLFKLYLAREMTSPQEPLERDPVLTFLRAWLPELDRGLLD
jgi:hypothetical protein